MLTPVAGSASGASSPDTPSPEAGPGGASKPVNQNTAKGAESARFAKNVLANWAGQFVVVASGFVLPRLLGDTLGQVQLGVWDFAWMIRSMISMSSFSMASSVGHYVSRFRASENWTELNRKIASTSSLVIITSTLAAAITLGAAYYTPWMTSKETVEIQQLTQLMVLAMGFAASLQMFIQLFGGVIVGVHRFDLLNKVEIAVDVLMVSGFFVALLCGGGLEIMGGLVVLRQLGDMIAKRMIARRLCPKIKFTPRWNDWPVMKEIAGYGTKTMANTLATLITYQAVIIMLTKVCGIGVVPLLARPRALIQFATRFVMGFARVLVPKAGELYESGSKDELGRLLISGTRGGLFLVLPIVSVFLCLGSPLLTVWMGPDYADQKVLTILGLGFLPFLSQRGTWHILMGVGAHGLASIASLAGAFLTVALSVLFVYHWEWGVEGAAYAMVIPLAIVHGIVFPLAGCRATSASIGTYALQSIVRPAIAGMPFIAILLAARWKFQDQPLTSLLAGVGAGGPILLIVYWFFALPDEIKCKIVGKIRSRGA